MNDRYSPSISKGPLTRLGRLLPHVPLQTGRCGDITGVERPMCQVDPFQSSVTGRFAAFRTKAATANLRQPDGGLPVKTAN